MQGSKWWLRAQVAFSEDLPPEKAKPPRNNPIPTNFPLKLTKSQAWQCLNSLAICHACRPLEMSGALAYPVHTIHEAVAGMHPDGLGWVQPSSAAVTETLTEVARTVSQKFCICF
jgi:hypothetical protein